MAYGVRWEDHRAKECIAEAERRACKIGETIGLGYLYRFEDHTYAARIDPYDDSDGNWYTVGPYLELEAILIRSKTPKGFTIHATNALGWRFISMEAHKKYACPSVEEALVSYIARKKRQHAIYEAKAKRASTMLERASQAYNKLVPPAIAM